MTGVIPAAAEVRRLLNGVVDAVDADDLATAYARSVWSVLTEPGDRVAGELIAAWGPVRALERTMSDAASAETAAVAGLTPQELAKARARWLPRYPDVERALMIARGSGVQLMTPEDSDWPRRAGDLGPYAPLCLWLLGDARVVGAHTPAVALVGARAASAYGEYVARDLAAECALADIGVFSGAAYGIDGAAHGAALDAGGVTVAVMAGGLERPYPAGHRELVGRIARTGAVISEVPCGTAPTKFRFLARNRLIATLTDATVVVEAAWRSGALNTAHHAQAIGRPLGVVPGPITSASSMGCHRLLREEAAVCITGISDLRELVGLEVGAGPAADEGYTDERTRLLDALSARTARTTDDVARRAGFDLEQAAALLGLLELEGVVARRATGWVQVSAAVRAN